MKKPVNVVGMLSTVALSLGLVASSGAVLADPNWPNKPITFIVPFPAGGGTDAFARPLSAQLTKQLGAFIC
jgi:tripartite-type tricarboxylate transporter receptor subunit TctC